MSDKAREWVITNDTNDGSYSIHIAEGRPLHFGESIKVREVLAMDKETEADLELISILLVEPDANTTADEWAAWGRIRAKLGV